ncbi:glycosyltransferase family 2 protein [Patescibacteria group bacterium]|nr:glycosyltransferase family 2 protein [Patescibacteria group bacterium]
MHNAPTISVLMPAYNAAQYIETSIESILQQTFHDFELICLDDASTDNTLEILRKLAKKEKRIRVLSNQQNLNIAASRNILVQAAKGKYIAWQDADDLSVATRLADQKSYLDSHPKVGIVGGYLEFFSDETTLSYRKYQADDTVLRHTIFKYSPVAQPAAMIRRECLKEAGSYGETLSPVEDLDMSFRIGQKWQFANLQYVVLRYRIHPKSATHRVSRHQEIITLKTRWKYHTHPAYTVSLSDIFFNLAQLLTLYLIPPKMRLQLFNLIRNSK